MESEIKSLFIDAWSLEHKTAIDFFLGIFVTKTL